MEMLIELASGKLLTGFIHPVPMDCVIQSHSGNGYWMEQGSYDHNKVVGYEKYIVGGEAFDKIGWTITIHGIGMFRDIDHVKEFYKNNMGDAVAQIIKE